jgi:hypothetical protein
MGKYYGYGYTRPRSQAVDLAAQVLLEADVEPEDLVLARSQVEAKPDAPGLAVVNRQPCGGGRRSGGLVGRLVVLPGGQIQLAGI